MAKDAREAVSATPIAASYAQAIWWAPERPPDLWLHLPVPPSANNLFVTRRDGRGRAKTSAYSEWLRHAGWHVKAQLPHRVAGPVRVWIEAGAGRQRDLDNLLKPVSDLLVQLGLFTDDRWIDDHRIIRRPERDNVLFVSVWSIGEARASPDDSASKGLRERRMGDGDGEKASG